MHYIRKFIFYTIHIVTILTPFVLWFLPSDFFDKGEAHLHPMLMRTVAEAIGVHESTVSRAVANKYMEMPHGVISLKKFFAANLASSQQGEELIAGQVKA